MVKQLVILGFGFLAFNFCGAQSIKGKTTIDVSGGPSLPTGNFGSSTMSNSDAGLAKTGGSFALNVAYLFSDYFGVTGQISYSSNGVNTDAIYDNYKQNYSNIKWSVEATPWTVGRAMGGIYASLPLSNEKMLAFEPYLLVGLAEATSPKMTIVGTVNMNKAQIVMHEGMAFSVLSTVGGNLRVWVSPKISLLGGLDYSSINCVFKDVKIEYPDKTATEDQSMKITNFTFKLGIGFAVN